MSLLARRGTKANFLANAVNDAWSLPGEIIHLTDVGGDPNETPLYNTGDGTGLARFKLMLAGPTLTKYGTYKIGDIVEEYPASSSAKWEQKIFTVSDVNKQSGHIAFGNGTFITHDCVLGTPTNIIYRSTDDGATWSAVTVSGVTAINGIAFGNGAFVVYGASGSTAKMIYSLDNGLTWTAVTIVNATFGGIAFGNGRFVSAAMTHVTTSPDGINWTTYTNSFSGYNTFDTIYNEESRAFIVKTSLAVAYSTTPEDANSWELLAVSGLQGAECTKGFLFTSASNSVGLEYRNIHTYAPANAAWMRVNYPYRDFNPKIVYNIVRLNDWFLLLPGINTNLQPIYATKDFINFRVEADSAGLNFGSYSKIAVNPDTGRVIISTNNALTSWLYGDLYTSIAIDAGTEMPGESVGASDLFLPLGDNRLSKDRYPELYNVVKDEFNRITDNFNLRKTTVSFTNGPTATVTAMAISNNQRYMAIAFGSAVYTFSITYNASNSGAPLTLVRIDTESIASATITSLAWSPDDKSLAVARSNTPYISVFEMRNGIFNGSPWASPASLPSSAGTRLAWSPDGKFLAMGLASSPFFVIYDVTRDYLAPAFTGAALPSSATDLAWSPDSKYLAFSHTANTYLTIYSTKSTGGFSPVLAKVGTFSATIPGASYAVCWSNDGRTVAVFTTASPYIRMYTVSPGNDYFTAVANPSPALVAPSGTMNAIFSKNSRYIYMTDGSATKLKTVDLGYNFTTTPVTESTYNGSLGSNPTCMAIYGNDRFLLIGETSSPYVTAWDLTMQERQDITNDWSVPQFNEESTWQNIFYLPDQINKYDVKSFLPDPKAFVSALNNNAMHFIRALPDDYCMVYPLRRANVFASTKSFYGYAKKIYMQGISASTLFEIGSITRDTIEGETIVAAGITGHTSTADTYYKVILALAGNRISKFADYEYAYKVGRFSLDADSIAYTATYNATYDYTEFSWDYSQINNFSDYPLTIGSYKIGLGPVSIPF